MKIKLLSILGVVFLSFLPFNNVEAAQDNRDLITEVFKEKGSLITAKYEGKDTHHCTAVMLTPTLGLTAAHCKDGGFEEGTIGTIYPGESGLATDAGSGTVGTFNPYSDKDFALIKVSDPSTAFSHYLKNVNTTVRGVNFSNLEGKEVYSIGYPIEKGGYKQYRTEGVITSVNGETSLYTTLQSSEGQSGSGVFLKENDQLIGIIIQGYNLDTTIVVPITSHMADWINRIRN
ncbi:serine protease [Staphylococcus coagulans]|uniref:Serine protease n=1 Tax=Staphylococcus coagulans TaxID=74706 RepID=A0ABU1EXS7_9STAP|nr:serine protease [Staphylococcus coagulans]MDR5602932.1 serine protease [Staphylococcus coagulans]